jgi:hypothetical protein
LTRWRVAIETGLLVAGIVVAKLVIDALSWDFVALSPLHTSIVAGGIFVIGLIVAGTLTDYKESDRVPAELAAALANIHEDGISIKETKPTFDLASLQQALVNVVKTFKHDLSDTSSRTCLTAIAQLSRSFLELERLEVPANYIVRLRQEWELSARTSCGSTTSSAPSSCPQPNSSSGPSWCSSLAS